MALAGVLCGIRIDKITQTKPNTESRGFSVVRFGVRLPNSKPTMNISAYGIYHLQYPTIDFRHVRCTCPIVLAQLTDKILLNFSISVRPGKSDFMLSVAMTFFVYSPCWQEVVNFASFGHVPGWDGHMERQQRQSLYSINKSSDFWNLCDYFAKIYTQSSHRCDMTLVALNTIRKRQR